jgi:hypothetical protein
VGIEKLKDALSSTENSSNEEKTKNQKIKIKIKTKIMRKKIL